MKEKSKRPSKNDFEKMLSKGVKSYEAEVGHWWKGQSANRAHKKAYHQIAKYLQDHLGSDHKKKLNILDYACGEGSFLEILTDYFPNSKFFGIDGSELMLNEAEKKLRKKNFDVLRSKAGRSVNTSSKKISLVHTKLPNFNLFKNKMDIVIFLFPNLTCGPGDAETYNKNGYKNRRDISVAEMLARFREMDPEDEIEKEDKEELFDDIMSHKVISRNLRGFLKNKGLALRTEYANASRFELTQLTQWRSLFAEGALEDQIKEHSSELLFKLIKSEYRRSSVILDVYHQTGDPSDKDGGYYCSLFDAA